MKAAIYSRKSKFSEKGESVENQIEMCKEYLNRNYTNIEEIKVYEDEGFSGGNINRPEFKKLLTDAKKNKFNVLICYRLDRISRNVADFSNTIEELQRHSIDFISIKEQFDTSSPMGRAMMNIAAVFAQLERETIAERVRDNMLELAKTGRWLGGTAPIGYKSEAVKYFNQDGKDKKMFKLTQITEEIETVKLIYKLYLEKRGFASVATYLCKNKYKGKNGGEFSRATVEQIIINPVYCISDENIFNWFKDEGALTCGNPDGVHGLMVYNKRNQGGKKPNPIDQWIVAVGKHEGVISSSTWLKCQNILRENRAKSSPRSGTGNKFLLSGMVVCGECGSGMSSWSHYNKNKDFMERYYRCNLRNRASNRCRNKMLNAYKAEEYVENYLLDLDMSTLLHMYKSNKKRALNKNAVKNQLSKLKKQLDKNNKIIKGLVRKFALIGEDTKLIQIVKTEIDNTNIENDEIKNKISELTTSMESFEIREEFVGIVKEALSNFKKFYKLVDIEAKRVLIKSLVKNIVWHGNTETIEINPITNNKPLPQGTVKRRSN
ncbi:recombinase family protein [Clostridium luticellarii]|uniref:DNA-invertase hin n=1 Tax=Clostridium luticellarii TaxID=1691940 RepID=A0A2T0BQ69_9CLOT|nr:recombinase family protein [Clostridium luticellarii]PRR86019.1 DNA-invertase hin [Clostridium luticellarii]